MWYHIIAYRYGRHWVYVSGILGVPVHELSHAALCPFFSHKIKEIVLFKPDGQGTLGTVSHCYNAVNPWAIIGNFFIGIAPIFGGCAAIALATYLILPNLEVLDVLYGSSSAEFNIDKLLYLLENTAITLMNTAANYPLNFACWFYVVASISLHLAPSPTDIKGGVVGFIFFLFAFSAFKAACDYYHLPIFTAIESYITAISLQLIISIVTSLTLITVFYLPVAIKGLLKR